MLHLSRASLALLASICGAFALTGCSNELNLDGLPTPAPRDAGFVAQDGGFVPADGGFVPADGGFVVADGGFAAVDGGFVVVDGGLVAADGGFAAVDGGFVTGDAGFSDAGFVVVDAGFSDAGFVTGDAGFSDAGFPDCTSNTDCPAPSPCHQNGVCTQQHCVYANLDEGTACTDAVDKCQVGHCDAQGSCQTHALDCSNPPESPDLANCTPGHTFLAFIGGGCGGQCNSTTGQCSYTPVTVNCPEAAATVLPQKHAYQVVLRNYLKTLTANDFTVPNSDVTFNNSFSLTDDQLYQFWIMAARDPGSSQGDFPPYAGFKIGASRFLLSSFEAGGPGAVCTTRSQCSGGAMCLGGHCSTPHVHVGREGPVNASALSFYYQWDYPGNPFYNQIGARNRSFAPAAADLMIMQDCHERGDCREFDYLSGALPQYGMVGLYANDSMTDACVVAAYHVGLRKLFDRIEAQVYGSPNSDMTMAAQGGIAYMARALGDPDVERRAALKAESIMEQNCSTAGFCRHQNGGFDASYEGYTMMNLIEGAMAQQSYSRNLTDWVQREAKLKAYMVLPEPDGKTYVGPSHFNPATSLPMVLDQGDYRPYNRDIAVGMVVDEGKYLSFGGRDDWKALPNAATMKADINNRIADALFFATDTGGDPTTATFPDWDERHYPGGQEPGVRLYVPGTYDKLLALKNANSDLTRPPFQNSNDFRETFGNEFAIARFGNVGVIFFGGAVDSQDEGSGFGGGTLSAFWTPSTGAALLGWNRGSQSYDTSGTCVTVADCGQPATCVDDDNNVATPKVCQQVPLTWADMLLWPSQALSGKSAGKSFSSARVITPTTSFDVSQPGRVAMTTTADLKTAASAPLSGSVLYARTLAATSAGLSVDVSATPSGTAPTIDELYEVIPVWMGRKDITAPLTTTLQFRIAGGSTQAATTTLTSNVIGIDISRGTGTVHIDFTTPQSVRLSPSQATVDYQWQPRGQNVLVHLFTQSGPLTSRSLHYSVH